MSEYYLTKDELYHHGILGQKWGVRNYQNKDGSLTAAGKIRYGGGKQSHSRKEWKQVKTDMANRQVELKNKYFANNKETAEKLASTKKRKQELYEKEHEKNAWLLDNDNEMARSMYDTNMKRSKNAYEKASREYDEFRAAGREYVSKQMKREFGQDYADWSKETANKAAIAAGVALVGAAAIYTMPLWYLMHSE